LTPFFHSSHDLTRPAAKRSRRMQRRNSSINKPGYRYSASATDFPRLSFFPAFPSSFALTPLNLSAKISDLLFHNERR
jgi:hypothetical protein